MIHHRIKHLFGIVTLMLLLPLAPAQHAQAALAPTLVKDINPGVPSSFPDQFVAMNGTLFFTTLDVTKQRSTLWTSDGTAAGTTPLKSVAANESERQRGINPVAVVGNTFYFGVSDSIPNSLWKSDGTSAGTIKVADVGANGGVAFQGKLFFRTPYGSPDDLTPPLWTSDGTAAGTVPIVFAGSEHKTIGEMVISENGLYFVTIDKREDGNGETAGLLALYRSDGTAAGTQKLLQIAAKGSEISDLTPNGNTLFFTAVQDRYVEAELWTSDGTVAGTARLVEATGDLRVRGGPFHGKLFNFNGLIVFQGGPSTNEVYNQTDMELWRSDGTPVGTYRIKDINPGLVGSYPYDFAVLNNLLYFIAFDNVNGAQMWRSDGTEAGTIRVTNLNPGIRSLVVAFNGALYFAAGNDSSIGYTLWGSDGTAGGTAQLIAPTTGQALKADSRNYGQVPFRVVNTTLFFAADDGLTGIELWKLGEATGRVTTGLQALYDFHEGTGGVVHDVAGVGNPLDLTVKKPSQVRWGNGSLEVTGFTPIASTGPAAKLINAAKASDAVTIEVWVTPAAIEQFSARILTISPNAVVRNVTLAQGVFNQSDSTIASLRLRTTTTPSSGQALFSPTGSIQPALTHLVATIAADGAVRMYVNGAQVAQAQASGTFDNWNTTYPLILAGELPSGRSWRGTYHLVALYDRALNAAEVEQNYAAGPEAP